MNSDDEMVILHNIWMSLDTTRHMWTHPINADRPRLGEFHHLVPQLRKYPKRFQNYYRMSRECYAELLRIMAPHLEKGSTNHRTTISADERLTIAIR